MRAELIPWDDARFVDEYERAREQSIGEGLTINGPKAAARVEHLLRARGFPGAVVEVDRTIDEALVHSARWIVRRDGADAADASEAVADST
ncbi:MAG TPA: hypothetical protein VFQ75_13845 [Candidatus Limnocylindrales bacterium]|nr:hypothetical protein [Candidatus Limnocylindrales bacterium]